MLHFNCVFSVCKSTHLGLSQDASLTPDPGVASSIRVGSNTFVEIDHGHSTPFYWIIQEGLLSVTSESMCTKYWLTALLVEACPEKSVVR